MKYKIQSLGWDLSPLVVDSVEFMRGDHEKVLVRRCNFFRNPVDFSIVSDIKCKNI